MAASFNKVLLLGNLTRDPEVRYTPKGTPVGDLGMAVNETYKAPDGTFKESVVYVNVEVWDRQAETCKQYLHKGSPIFVEGRLKFEQWETPQGEKKSRLSVRAERVQFLGSPGGAGGSGGGAGSSSGSGERRYSASPAEDRAPSVRETRPPARPTPAPTPAEDVPPFSEEDDIPF